MALQKPAKRTTPKQQKLDFMKLVKDVKTPGLFIIGFIAGKQVIVLFDKNQTVDKVVGKDGKKLIVPALAALGGLSISQLSKDRNLKMLGYGFSAAGIHDGVKKMTGKDLLAGNLFDAMPSPDEIQGPGEGDFRQIPSDTIADRQLSVNYADEATAFEEDADDAPIIPAVEKIAPVEGAGEIDEDFDFDDEVVPVEGIEAVSDIDITEIV